MRKHWDQTPGYSRPAIHEYERKDGTYAFGPPIQHHKPIGDDPLGNMSYGQLRKRYISLLQMCQKVVEYGKPVGDGTLYTVPGNLMKQIMGRVVTDRQAYEKDLLEEK